MTGQEALDAMREVLTLGTADPEAGHGAADQILCDLLRTLGFNALVDVYDSIPKWYA